MFENTYVVFTSDNGFFNGEHRLPVGKNLVYEEALRVPLVIRGPGIPAGETRSEMVSNLDLTATVAALASATPGRASDGRSLVPLFAGDVPWRTALLVEGTDLVPALHRIYGYYAAVRTAGYKYAEHVNRKSAYLSNEFYDLNADPYEIDSRPKDKQYRGAIAKLKPLLSGLETCAGDSCWVADTFPKLPPRPRVPPQIGPPCRHCKYFDTTHSLEPAETDK